ncbi:MAG: hypothetical protein JW937_08645, partial [Candidatus Omnitrophica bacterium]|nr:hypothetical protein [Candidatus Omnitrophota bacterium]
YVVVAPHVLAEYDEENYRNLLRGKVASAEELAKQYEEAGLRQEPAPPEGRVGEVLKSLVESMNAPAADILEWMYPVAEGEQPLGQGAIDEQKLSAGAQTLWLGNADSAGLKSDLMRALQYLSQESPQPPSPEDPAGQFTFQVAQNLRNQLGGAVFDSGVLDRLDVGLFYHDVSNRPERLPAGSPMFMERTAQGRWKLWVNAALLASQHPANKANAPGQRRQAMLMAMHEASHLPNQVGQEEPRSELEAMIFSSELGRAAAPVAAGDWEGQLQAALELFVKGDHPYFDSLALGAQRQSATELALRTASRVGESVPSRAELLEPVAADFGNGLLQGLLPATEVRDGPLAVVVDYRNLIALGSERFLNEVQATLKENQQLVVLVPEEGAAGHESTLRKFRELGLEALIAGLPRVEISRPGGVRISSNARVSMVGNPVPGGEEDLLSQLPADLQNRVPSGRRVMGVNAAQGVDAARYNQFALVRVVEGFVRLSDENDIPAAEAARTQWLMQVYHDRGLVWQAQQILELFKADPQTGIIQMTLPRTTESIAQDYYAALALGQQV